MRPVRRRSPPQRVRHRGARAQGGDGQVPSRATYVAADAAAITVSLVIAHLLRFGVSAALLPGPNVPYVLVAVFAVPVWLAVLALAGCYDRLILGVGSDEYRRVLNGGVHFLAVVAIAHFLGRLVIARGYVGVLIPVALVLTLLTRFVLRQWLHRQRRHGRYVHRLLLVGTPRSVVEVGQHLVRSEWSGFLVVGVCVATDRPDLGIGSASVPVVGTPDDVAGAVAASRADAVAVTTESRPGELTALVGELAGSDVTVLVAPAVADVAGPRTVVRDVAGLPLLHVAEPTLTGPQRVAKEVFDRLGAALALLVLAPVFAGDRPGGPTRQPRPRVLHPDPRRPRRPPVQHGEVPHDGRRRRPAAGRARGPQRGRRPAVQDAGRSRGSPARAGSCAATRSTSCRRS